MRILLSLLGIIFGTAGYSAIRLSNESVLSALSSTARSLREEAPYILRSASGPISEEIFEILLKNRNIKGLHPKIVRHLEAFDGEKPLGSVTLVGLDLLKERGGRGGDLKFLGEEPFGLSTLKQESIQLIISGERRTLKLKRLEEQQNESFIFVDIATAQRLLGEFGELDEIGLELSDPSSLELPPGLQLVTADSFEGELLHATKALRLNLHFLAMLSLIVSALLIYTSVSFILLKRRAEIGILLCTGVRRRIIVKALIIEAIMLGFIGSCLGAILGFSVASTVVSEFSKTISALYVPVQSREVQPTAGIFSEILVLGIITAILGSISPILSESRRSLFHLLHPRNYENLFQARARLFPILALLCLLLSLVLPFFNLLNHSLFFGFLPPAFLTLGWLFLAPSYSSAVLQLLKRRFPSREFFLAVSALQSSPRRVSATVAATGIAIGLFLGVSTMISSFRGTVSNWLETILRADLYISSEYAVVGESSAGIPSAVIEWVSSKGEVDPIQSRMIYLQGSRVLVHGVNFDSIKKYNRLIFLQGSLAELTDERILVSESFRRKFGDLTELQIEGRGNFKIQGVFADYSTDGGVIYFPSKLYQRIFNQNTVQGLSLYLSPESGLSVENLLSEYRRKFPELRLSLRSQKGIKDEVYKVFEQTFSITKALQVLALVLSLFVILNTVLMLGIERERDGVIQWAIGLRKGRLLSLISLEGGILGGISALFGLIQGLSFALLLVFFVNRFFFGWSISFDLALGLFLQTLLFVTAATMILALFIGLFRRYRVQLLRGDG